MEISLRLSNLANILLPVVLAIIMFGAGLTLVIEDFIRIKKSPKLIISGIFAQYILMPLTAFLVVSIFNLEYEYALGVILLGACPGGLTSNLIVFIAKLDVALSVTLTAFSTLLCTLITPAIVLFLSKSLAPTNNTVSISFIKMAATVFIMMILPLSLGMFMRYKSSAKAIKMQRGFRILGSFFLFCTIVFITFQNKTNLLSGIKLVGLAVLLHNSSALLLGYFIPKWLLKIKATQSRTICLEVGLQNTALAMTLAVQFFNLKTAVIPALYSLQHFLSAGILVFFWLKFYPVTET